MAERRKTKGLQLIKGVWIIDKVVRGIRIHESTGTSNEAEAQEILARRINEVREIAIHGARPCRQWRDAATRYLTECSHKRSILRDAQSLADLDPYIGEMRLDEVCWDTLAQYRADRSNLAQATLIRNLSVVRRITRLAATLWRDQATRKTWLETAPLLPLGRPKKKRKPYPLTWDEQRLFFSELAPHLEVMALFKVNTGTRDAEVCGLLWEWEQKVEGVGSVFVVPDLLVKNAEPRVVVLNDVAQSVVDAQRGKHATHVFCYTPPAPKKARRIVLRRRMRLQGRAAPGVPVTAEELAAFEALHARGPRPITEMGSSGWAHARRRAAKRYTEVIGRDCPDGFARLRVHDLKHTFGRRLRAAGVKFEDRQDLLGHKSRSVTTDYSAAEIAELKRLANLVNEKRESSMILRAVEGGRR